MVDKKKRKPETSDEQAEKSAEQFFKDIQEYAWLRLTEPDRLKILDKITELVVKYTPELIPDVLEYILLEQTDPSKALHKLMELTEKCTPTNKKTKEKKKTKKAKQNKATTTKNQGNLNSKGEHNCQER